METKLTKCNIQLVILKTQEKKTKKDRALLEGCTTTNLSIAGFEEGAESEAPGVKDGLSKITNR